MKTTNRFLTQRSTEWINYKNFSVFNFYSRCLNYIVGYAKPVPYYFLSILRDFLISIYASLAHQHTGELRYDSLVNIH